MKLEGQVAVVVGASSGVGLATARALAAEGVRVHALARRANLIDPTEHIVPHALDATDEHAVASFFRELGDVDIVVYAAGTNVKNRRLAELDDAGWRTLVETNLSGAVNVMRAALPALRRRRGQAVLIASISGRWPDASGPGYQATKAGVRALAHAIALEEHTNGVRVCAILPGLIDTSLLEKRPAPPPPEMRAKMLRPEDIAEACVFVLTRRPEAYVPELVILPTQLQAIGGDLTR